MNELFESIPLIGIIVLSIVFILTGIYQIIQAENHF